MTLALDILLWSSVGVFVAYNMAVRPFVARRMRGGGPRAGQTVESLYKWDAIVCGAFILAGIICVLCGRFDGPPTGRGTDWEQDEFIYRP